MAIIGQAVSEDLVWKELETLQTPGSGHPRSDSLSFKDLAISASGNLDYLLKTFRIKM